MPRKPGYTHNQRSRDAIKATQLINRLTKHVMADAPILEPSQVNGIKILLAKVLPDLSNMEMSAEVTQLAGREPLSDDDWARKHGVATPAGATARLN